MLENQMERCLIAIWWVLLAVICLFIHQSLSLMPSTEMDSCTQFYRIWVYCLYSLYLFSVDRFVYEKTVHEFDSLNERRHWTLSIITIFKCRVFENENDKKHFSFFVQRWSFSHFEYITIFEIIIHICVEYWICDVASWMLIWCHVLIIVFWIRLANASFSHRFIHLLFAVCCSVFAKKYPTGQIKIHIIRLWSNNILFYTLCI